MSTLAAFVAGLALGWASMAWWALHRRDSDLTADVPDEVFEEEEGLVQPPDPMTAIRVFGSGDYFWPTARHVVERN